MNTNKKIIKIQENYPGQVEPSTIYEYVFKYSFAISFIGAIFHGIVSVINLDPTSILVNKNIGVALNIYILACSIISTLTWFNIPNPILVSSVLNPATVLRTLN